MFLFHFEKRVTVFLFIHFSLPSFVCVRCNQPDNLAFRTTKVEDTRLTLEAIPFQVGVTNSFIYLLLQTYEKKIAEFLFL